MLRLLRPQIPRNWPGVLNNLDFVIATLPVIVKSPNFSRLVVIARVSRTAFLNGLSRYEICVREYRKAAMERTAPLISPCIVNHVVRCLKRCLGLSAQETVLIPYRHHTDSCGRWSTKP